MSKHKVEKLHAWGDRLLVKLDNREDESHGGIIMPGTVSNKPQKGTVVELGTQNINMSTGEPLPWGIKVGDRVYCTKHGGDEVMEQEVVNGKLVNIRYQLIREGDIIGKLEPMEVEA